ncbi:hypothetical protein ACHQM5_017679 [Ranunculus cassubicifolius]
MSSKSPPYLVLLLTLLTLSSLTQARFLSSSLVSDGINNDSQIPRNYLSLPSSMEEEEESSSCEQTYGFLPCTTSALGNSFMIIVYGFLMFTSANLLSNGSERLLEILGPGIIGGLFLPVLGALPDAMLILVSGLSGSVEVAQTQVLVGMGLLAGSTVMLLTVLWGACVVVGKCDIEDSTAVDKKNTKGFSLTGSGVTTDIWTSYAAMFLVISVVPFIIVQLPQIFHTSSGKRLAILVALIASIAMLITYCVYQVFQPWIQERKIAYAKHKHVIAGLLHHYKDTFGMLITEDGEPNEEVITKLFKSVDGNDDGFLDPQEIRALMIGMHLEKIDFDDQTTVEKVLRDFDSSGDSRLDQTEFVHGISRWLREAMRSRSPTHPHTMNFVDEFHQQAKKEHDSLGNEDEEGGEDVENPKMVTLKAVLMLLLGTVIAAVFADPLVDVVDNFSTATSIPSFFISFIILPLATNSSEAVSALIFASRKKKKTASLTFSEIYGGATMNNILCLAVFLGLVYVRNLSWDFSAEVLVILIVCVLMGIVGSIRTTFPLWTSFVAFALYPLSLLLVYLLDYVFGWS